MEATDQTAREEYTFRLLGGRLCLDFTNTVGSHASDRPNEHLTDYAGLVAWSRQAGILAEGEAQRLLNEAAARPEAARTVLEEALSLREAMYRIFSAVAGGRSPEEGDLATLNAALSQAWQHSKLVATPDGFGWDWVAADDALDRMLWPVAESAAELLTSGELQRVRECSGDTCGWLFVDMSRNRSRRWCDMEDCGNRAKARRHYHRTRSAGT